MFLNFSRNNSVNITSMEKEMSILCQLQNTFHNKMGTKISSPLGALKIQLFVMWHIIFLFSSFYSRLCNAHAILDCKINWSFLSGTIISSTFYYQGVIYSCLNYGTMAERSKAPVSGTGLRARVRTNCTRKKKKGTNENPSCVRWNFATFFEKMWGGSLWKSN